MDIDRHVVLVTLGALFAIGMATDTLGRRLRLPRVTLLILFGALAGPVGFDVVPATVRGWYEFLATMALTMVAFLLGGELTLKSMRSHGRTIIVISVAVVCITVAVVGAGLVLVGVALPIALLIAGIATATDPAATRDVIRQSRAEGPFSETLQGIVAIDDAWGLIAFSLILIVVNALVGNGVATVLEHAAWEFGGAVGVGVAVGVPAAYLSGRVQEGEPSQAEALAVVFLIAGLSEWLGVSFLMAGVIDGLNVSVVLVGDLFPSPLTVTSDFPSSFDENLISGVLVIAEEYEAGESVGLAYHFGTLGDLGTFGEFAISTIETAVPEPAALAVLGLGFAGLGALRRRRHA